MIIVSLAFEAFSYIYDTRDIDGKRLERALAHATADTFRTRSIACRNTSVSFKRADLSGAIKLLYCRTNGKKRKKKRERARRGLKRFFTCHWPTSGISVLTRGSPATCRASAINDYRRRFGHRVRYLIAPPTLASFFIGPSFCFPSPPVPLHSFHRRQSASLAARLIGERIVAPPRCIIAGISSKPG